MYLVSQYRSYSTYAQFLYVEKIFSYIYFFWYKLRLHQGFVQQYLDILNSAGD